ncbi:MAG TPA: TonB-dependent receptor [Candidatus Krumholzibacteria bacterium]|nr:TonB-dependent receptor [Candidatus Krumholzibacteria bacterium]
MPRLRAALFVIVLAVGGWPASVAAGSASPDSSASAAVRVSPVQRRIERTSLVSSSGHARSIPGSAYFLPPDFLNQLSQSFPNIDRVVADAPGVYAFGADGYGLRPNLGMRGVDPHRSAGITVLEDGILSAPAPYAAPALLAFPTLGRAESVEILGGPGAIVSGPRTSGGTLNMATPGLPDDLIGTAQLSIGSDNARTLRAGYGDSWNNASWYFGTHQTRTDGFKLLDGGGDTGFDDEDYLIKLGLHSALDADLYQEVLLKFGYDRNSADNSELGLTEDDFDHFAYRRYAASQKDRSEYDGTQFLIQHFAALNDAVDITTSIYRNSLDLTWDQFDRVGTMTPADVLAAPDTYADEYAVIAGDSASADGALRVKSNHREYFANGIQSTLGAAFDGTGGRHQLEAGVRFHHDQEDRLHRNDTYGMAGGGVMVLTTRGADGGDGGTDNQVNDAKSLAVFARDRFAAGGWSVTPGVRVERIETRQTTYTAAGDAARSTTPDASTHTTTVFTPGVGGLVQATPEIAILAGIHTGFAPPAPGIDADAERTLHYEAGVRTRYDHFSAGVIGFWSDHQDLISITGTTTGNGGSARVYGAELSAGYGVRDPEYRIEIAGAYTFTRAEFTSGFESADSLWGTVTAGDGMPYVPEHVATASVLLGTKRSLATVSASYMSRTRTAPGSGDFPGYAGTGARVLVDIVTEYALLRGVRVFASVYNVGDEVYVASRFFAGAAPGAPRTFTAGLKFEL